MASPLQIRGRTDPQPPALTKATPPDKQIRIPLTPPTTNERFSHGSGSAVDYAVQIFRKHQEHSLLAPWTSIPLRPAQYQRLLGQLKQDPVLLDHVDNSLRNAKLVAAQRISHRGGSSAEYAARIANGGCARIFLKEDSPDGNARDTRAFHRREPDAQFQHRDAEYPGIVLEISYSQDGKDLKKLAWDYIQYSNGDIKVVIGIDIKYNNTKEATLLVWRPRYIREDGEELDILEAEKTVKSQSFRAADGSVDNPTNILCLHLGDFATDEILTNCDFRNSPGVNISYQKLAECSSTPFD